MDDNTHHTLWALVKLPSETDQVNKNKRERSQLISVNLHPQWSAREVQASLLKAVGLGPSAPASSQSIVKVRDAHGALLPLTPAALHSSPIQPLVLEVCSIHQHVQVEESQGDVLPPTFRTAVETIIKRFEERLAAVETGLEGLEGRRAAQVEEELHRIQETLAFMTKRLDLTHVPNWIVDQTS